MINFLSLLGWSLDDRTEVLSRDQLIEHFSLERVARSPAVFNVDKLDWMNGLYIRESDPADLAAAVLAHWSERPPAGFDRAPDPDLIGRAVPLIRERIKSLSEAEGMLGFLFTDELRYEDAELVPRKMDPSAARRALAAALEALCGVDPFEAPVMEERLRALAAEMGMRLGPLLGPLRVAVTGRRVSPPLFESMELLGRERTLGRTAEAVSRLERAEVAAV